MPRELGGDDTYKNLIFVTKDIHILIHAKSPDVISKYVKGLKISENGMKKLNKLRVLAGLEKIK